MPVSDRVQLILERALSFPYRETGDRKGGDQREGQEQKMMHPEPRPAALTHRGCTSRRVSREVTGGAGLWRHFVHRGVFWFTGWSDPASASRIPIPGPKSSPDYVSFVSSWYRLRPL